MCSSAYHRQYALGPKVGCFECKPPCLGKVQQVREKAWEFILPDVLIFCMHGGVIFKIDLNILSCSLQ